MASLKLQPFDESTGKYSLIDYITYFDSLIVANEWDDEKVAHMLIPLLGIGTCLLDNVSETATSKYSTMKATLLESGVPHRVGG